MQEIRRYNRYNINTLPWPETKDGQYAKSLLLPLVQLGTSVFFDNIDVEIQVLLYEDLVFPLVVANLQARQQNAYVCSPMGHYIHYAREEVEIEMGDNPLLSHGFQSVLGQLGKMIQPLDFEKVVYVNNWLLSTNLYPDFDPERLGKIGDYLVQAFPQHALIFRSINQMLNPEIFETLLDLSFEPIFSRQVYILDPAKGVYKKKNPYKEDLRLAKKTTYRWLSHDEIRLKDIPRLRWLYDDLYLRKYSYLNPQFNELFIRESLRHHWLTYFALEKDGQIDGMVGYFERNGVFTTPMVGYDCALPQKLGLYRLMTLKLIQAAESHGWILNHSSGVSRFKTLRGCEPAMEYNMVYYHHLPYKQQLPWRLLLGLSKTAVEPVMKAMKL